MPFRVSSVTDIAVLLRSQARQAELFPAAVGAASQHQQPVKVAGPQARCLLTLSPPCRVSGPPATAFSLCPWWPYFQWRRSFATKRHRLDEYDSYEATVNPKHVPVDFGRVPIQLQSAGELKETIAVAGRMRLANPNFWMRCSSAVRDLSGGFRVRELVSIVNAYAKAGYRDEHLFDHLAQLIALQAHDGRATDLAVCLQAFARLGFHHEPLFDLLALQCIRKIEELGPRGIATVVAAYGGINHPHPHLFNKLAVHAEAQAAAFCNLELTQLLWGCARVGYKNSKLLNCCADQLILRLPTCTALEALTATEAFASLGFCRTDLVSSLSAFFLRKIRSIPLRRLPMLLQTFTTFDRLAGSTETALGGPAPPSTTANAALYRAVLPVIARQATCFSLCELAAVDSDLRSVGLTHDLLTRALQQLLPQRIADLSPQQCVEMLQQAAARGSSAKDQAVGAAVKALLGAPDGLQGLSDAAVVCLLESLKDLRCLNALAICGSLIFGKEAAVTNKRLTGPELLVAQRILLQAFPSGELFAAAYREGHLSERGPTLDDDVSASKEKDALQHGALPSNASPADVSARQPDAVYACAAATAANAPANALVLAICRYRGDPGTGLWLELLMKGGVATADPELLPALLVELARMQREQTEAEDPAIFDFSQSIKTTEINTQAFFPPLPSSAQLSRRFCRVIRYLMEGPAEGPCNSSASGASQGGLEEDAERAGEPFARFLFSRISNTAAATAAKVLRHHPKPEVARRYAEQLCGLVCWRLLKVAARTEGTPGQEGGNIARRQEAKCLARLLQSLVTLGADIPLELLQQLAYRLRGLGGGDILAVLRRFPSESLDANLRQQLARAVNLRFRDLKSWRKLSELRIQFQIHLVVSTPHDKNDPLHPGLTAQGTCADLPLMWKTIFCNWRPHLPDIKLQTLRKTSLRWLTQFAVFPDEEAGGSHPDRLCYSQTVTHHARSAIASGILWGILHPPIQVKEHLCSENPGLLQAGLTVPL